MDFVILSLIPSGEERWVYRYNGPANSVDCARSLVCDAAGNIYATGYSCDIGTSKDIVVISLTPSGEERWVYRYDAPTNDADEAYSLILGGDGYLYLCGMSIGINTYYDIIVISLDLSGSQRWVYRYDGGVNLVDVAYSITYGQDSNIYTAGYAILHPLHERDWIVISLDTFGNERWVYTYNDPDDGIDICVALCYGTDDNIYTAGESWTGREGFTVISVTNSGDERWKYIENGLMEDRAEDIIYGSDGNIYTAGYLYNYTSSDFAIVSLTTDGQERWVYTYNGTGNAQDIAYSIICAPDGNIYAGGKSEPDGELNVSDITVVSLAPSGVERWVYCYDGAGDEDEDHFDRLNSLTTDSYGNIYGAGKSIGVRSLEDITVIALDPLWHLTDDPLSLAYNGSRHLVRRPNSQELHSIYTAYDEVIYRYSSNGGTDWSLPEIIGEGNYPAITLNSDHLSSVAWTDDEGGLWYGKCTPSGGWNTYHLYDPSPYDPYLNTPPSIVVTRSLMGDTVHILATLFLEDIEHLYGAVAEYVFPIQNPGAYTVKYIEGGTAPNHKFCYNPSITKDFQERLHAVWQRGDTVCYATREIGRDWNNWGWQFEDEGLNSAHPFVETYGDSIFVVWQYEADEEVYRARRYLSWDYFLWRNLSRTPRKVSLYPVNASGFVTTFVDETDFPAPDDWYEIYWKRKPEDPLNNISESPHIKSIYPHTSLKFNQIADNQLYVVWQEGNISPYEIKFKMVYVPDRASAFFSSNNGNPEPSPYLVARDTFFDNWTIPVDAGDESITYQFSLEPGYLYKAKTIAYHESSGEWRARIKIDNAAEFLVRYNAHIPETLEIWIPPVLYQDSIVEVAFSRLAGDYAAMGPLYIYRYEYEEGRGGSPGGPMAQNNKPFDNTVLTISPTLFCQALSIRFQTQTEKEVNIKVYDVSGRLVKNIYKGKIKGNCTLNWHGDDENGRAVSHGVYFVRIKNVDSGETSCMKVLKIK